MAKKKSRNKVHIRRDDRVQVMTGAYKGVVSDVYKVFPKENKVLIHDVNVVTKHQKPNSVNQQGGIINKEAKIDASNVLLYCDKCGRGVRHKTQVNEDGTKTRICSSCGASLDA